MDLICGAAEREYWFHSLREGASRAVPDAPYACLLWDDSGSASKQEMRELAHLLVETGCRYVVCGGQDSEAWHDSVDQVAWAMHDPNGEPFVMTTYHQDESISEVVFFLVTCTANVEDHELTRCLILQRGESVSVSKQLQDAVRTETRSSSGVEPNAV